MKPISNKHKWFLDYKLAVTKKVNREDRFTPEPAEIESEIPEPDENMREYLSVREKYNDLFGGEYSLPPENLEEERRRYWKDQLGLGGPGKKDFWEYPLSFRTQQEKTDDQRELEKQREEYWRDQKQFGGIWDNFWEYPIKPKKSSISIRAGKLDYPKKMLKEISNWAREVSPKLKTGIFRKPEKTRIAKTFRIDLSDTDQCIKSPELLERLNILQEKGFDEDVMVSAYSTDPKEQDAGYDSPSTGMHEIDLYDLNSLIKRGILEESIAHELIHLAQNAIQNAVSIDYKIDGVGIPGKYNKETFDMYSEIKNKEDKAFINQQHARSDVEFYPLLNDEIAKMSRYLSKYIPEHHRVALGDFIENSYFLNQLKAFNIENYQKAIRELYRAFSQSTNK